MTDDLTQRADKFYELLDQERRYLDAYRAEEAERKATALAEANRAADDRRAARGLPPLPRLSAAEQQEILRDVKNGWGYDDDGGSEDTWRAEYEAATAAQWDPPDEPDEPDYVPYEDFEPPEEVTVDISALSAVETYDEFHDRMLATGHFVRGHRRKWVGHPCNSAASCSELSDVWWPVRLWYRDYRREVAIRDAARIVNADRSDAKIAWVNLPVTMFLTETTNSGLSERRHDLLVSRLVELTREVLESRSFGITSVLELNARDNDARVRRLLEQTGRDWSRMPDHDALMRRLVGQASQDWSHNQLHNPTIGDHRE
ncbi:hypothetical protein [Nesterenkonia jeotgali]|uniref:Uncharacterized protein n=1 Tax=Nesterenkonia jeotgali TaxID=317018 RepID=A0A839FN55_9MICC|nr:hypothetical protein [Nesterenkonia jeotgali]MBA8921336.1 hypothetical protein [Nesterenkonia jeotgali]